MNISIVVAAAENSVIGYKNEIPWKLPTDMRRFKEITTGHHIIMGRRTYESIGKPLPNRTNIVISNNPDLTIEGAVVLRSLEQALELAESQGETDAMVIGGAAIYAVALSLAHRIYLTRVKCYPQGDVFFPYIDTDIWETLLIDSRYKNDRDEHDFDFCILVRRGLSERK